MGGGQISGAYRLWTGGPGSSAKSSLFSEEKPHCFALSFSAFDPKADLAGQPILAEPEALMTLRRWLPHDVRAHRDHEGIEPLQAKPGDHATPQAREGLQGCMMKQLHDRRFG
jgi:hypothetical protein